MNPVTKRINMPVLRRSMFGKDRLPDYTIVTHFPQTELLAYYSEFVPHAVMDLKLIPRKPVIPGPGRQKHRSAHRLFARCNCGRWIPVGRLAQHKCNSR